MHCTPPERPAQSRASQPTPRDGGRVVRRLDADVQSLSYLLQTSEEERQVFAYLYEPLVAFNANLDPIPSIAARWEIAEGGKVYTFHLDPRATFSDGTPVRGRDVVFTLTSVLDANAPQFAAAFSNLDRARTTAIDDRTVRVVFKEPRVAQLLAFNLSVLPEHVYRGRDLATAPEVVGNGPYVLAQRVSGQSIVLERRTNYWREAPHLQTVAFRVIADDAVAWNALLRGDIDVGRVSNETWWREHARPEVTQRLAFETAWLLAYNCFAWNLDDPRFADPDTRRALAMSFDRDAVIEKLYHGQARPVTGPFTPDQWANDASVPAIPYDLAGAAELLGRAGWRDSDRDGVLDRNGVPFSFDMLIPVSATARDQTQILQDALRRIGVRMEIVTLDGAAFYDRVLKRNFQSAFFAWFNEPDPDPYVLLHSTQVPPAGFNVGGYHTDAADALMDRARTEFDRPRREALYRELHRLVARDQPYLWTVQVASKWAVNRRVRGVETSKGLGLFLWHPGPFAWWVEDSKR